MIKKLPVKTPIVNTYTSYGAIFSILPQSAFPWIINNFIQLTFIYDWDMATFDSHRMLMSNCPSLDYYEESEAMLLSRGNNPLKNAIVEGIGRDEYLFFYVDRFYLSIAEEYGKEHMPHEIFIYGYDLEEDKVYVADNLHQGKFIFTDCRFSELIEAYENIELPYAFMHSVRYVKVHENTICNLNINQVIHGIDSYLHSYETFDMVGQLSKMAYGLSVIDYILELIANAKGNELDIRFFHLFYEHKLLMEMRVKYLIECGYIEEKELNIEEFMKEKKNALILRNLVIKYNYLRSNELLMRIYHKLFKMKNRDVKLLSHLLWILRKGERGYHRQ